MRRVRQRSLVVFDLDGTLADTLPVDHRCFVRAFQDEFGIDFLDEDWSTYRHTTDSGITPEVLERAWGRPPERAEVERHKRRFVALLSAAAVVEPQSFRAVGGAARLLAAVAADPSWAAVIATGSWRESALLKLRLAGLETAASPLASADDALEREAIVRHGVALASAGGGTFEHTVLVGDKPWDVRAAARLGFGFVGVATAARRPLLDAGAGIVLDDFDPLDAALEALASAPRPQPEGSLR